MSICDFLKKRLSRRPQEPVKGTEREQGGEEEETEIEELVALEIL